MNNQLNNFVNKYSLSKTLRFELKPVDSNGKSLSTEEYSKVFEKILEQDRKIKLAYEALKPVLDNIHEEIITNSLKEAAQNLDFSEYWTEYQKGKNKKLKNFENDLRVIIGKSFSNAIEDFNKNANKTNKKGEIKPFFKMSKDVPVACAELLDYVVEKYKDDIELQEHIEVLKSFFTYFTNYNTNRANYYEFKKEADTSVASRTIHNNLPFFCDNALLFNSGRKEEYLSAYKSLNDLGRITQIKEADTGEMIELKPIDERMFEVSNFSNHLTQSGIEEYNTTIGHYNALVNLYNQAKGLKKNEKLKPFKELYKQIGCGKRKAVYEVLKFDTKQQQIDAKEDSSIPLSVEGTLETIAKAGKKYFAENKQSDKNHKDIYEFMHFLKENDDWEGIYWPKAAVDIISNKYLKNWHEIKGYIQKILESKDNTQKELIVSVATFDKKREEQLKINDAVELSGLFCILNQNENWTENFFKNAVLEDRKDIINEKLSPSKNLVNLICADMEDLAKEFCKKSKDILQITDYKNEDNILKIKEWLDAAKYILWNVKYFDVKPSKVKGNSISSEITEFLNTFLHSEEATWFNWYDLVRNYLTKKPQDDVKKNKLKLNFEKGNLLNGFVESKGASATQYGGYLFRKVNESYFEKTRKISYDYYLGISKNQNLFRCDWSQKLENQKDKSGISEFQRLNYYQLNPQTENSALKKFILQFAFGNNSLISKIESHLEEKFTSARTCVKSLEKDFQEHFDKLISKGNFTLNEYDIVKDSPKLKLYGSKKYKYFADFFDDIQKKEFKYLPINQEEFLSAIDGKKKNNKGEIVESSRLFLFKITNKDLSFAETFSKGLRKKPIDNKNLHTVYFESLMSGKQNVIDIGTGDIFYREAAKFDRKPAEHPKGSYLIDRIEKETSKSLPYKVHSELFRFANGKIKHSELDDETLKYLDKNGNIDTTKVGMKIANYDIIKDRRFTENKFQLHLSILLNYGKDNQYINDIVNDNFTQSNNAQFLGIDRGEKHLIYYSLVDANGKIIKQGHLDIIDNGKNKKDYLHEINEAAKNRREKQENWQQKGNIANLKDGYISLVVHEIVQLMKDEKTKEFKPTFIVMEDLNTGFKRSRQKFEQQVYQKFELALAKKLNYLVDKNISDGEIGSVSKALQLTPPISNYKDLENRKQVGVLLYTRANYTSVTDPVTGWRKTIYLKKGNENDIKKQILMAFSEIGIDYNGDYFFEYPQPNTEHLIRLWSSKNGNSLERYRFKRGNSKNEPIVESYNLKDLLDKLFVNFDNSKSLKKQMEEGKELSKINEHTAWETLRFVIDIIQQIRNSGDVTKGQDDNFLQSPVRNEQGEHYDSRIYKNIENPELPKDADANGAYNIARKGIIMYEHIKHLGKNWNNKIKIDGNETIDLDLFISDEEWDLYNTNKEIWTKKLSTFASKKAKEPENKKNKAKRIVIR